MAIKTRPLTDADRERVMRAIQRDEFDETQPLFAPDSITRRVHHEAALLLGGGRALMMQIAHPLVAEGVARFSNFRKDPLGRLWRTLELTLTVSFRSAAEAVAAVNAIDRAHARVHGELSERVGPFPAGTRFDGLDPDLMFWVHATLVDSAMLVYERFVAPLTAAEKTAYYEESKVTARMMGIDEARIPRTLTEFRKYMREMLRSDTLSVGTAGRDVANAVLYPSRPAGLSPALLPARLLTFEILPPVLRERFGLFTPPMLGPAVTAVGEISRLVLPWVPQSLRAMPYTPGAWL